MNEAPYAMATTWLWSKWKVESSAVWKVLSN